MIATEHINRRRARLLVVDAQGRFRHHARGALAALLEAGDLIIANDAATLPASLRGIHVRTGEPIEVRLAGWISLGDPTRFIAIAFGSGDHHTRTEDRPPPPALAPGDGIALGPLHAVITRLVDHPRLIEIAFSGDGATVLAGLARHGRPIQYAHARVPLPLWDMWTSIAADPIAFEPPSAGFALDWRTLAAWRRRGVRFATLTHAAGISSTGDPGLDARLPFEEPYRIPERTAAVIGRTQARGGRILAIGTSVVRALEAAAGTDGCVRAGGGTASGRIGRDTALRVVDAILTGVHARGESHYELLRAFADDAVLVRMSDELAAQRYRGHEFGDSVLIERPRRSVRDFSERRVSMAPLCATSSL